LTFFKKNDSVFRVVNRLKNNRLFCQKPQRRRKVRKISFLEKTLKNELKKAGLPKKVEQVIGRVYMFECDNGSHAHFLAGVITAINFSDERGLTFQVSNSTIWGKPLACICYNNGQWAVVIDIEIPKNLDEDEAEKAIADRYIYGSFQLLKNTK
jgi:hypothetical protein